MGKRSRRMVSPREGQAGPGMDGDSNSDDESDSDSGNEGDGNGDSESESRGDSDSDIVREGNSAGRGEVPEESWARADVCSVVDGDCSLGSGETGGGEYGEIGRGMGMGMGKGMDMGSAHWSWVWTWAPTWTWAWTWAILHGARSPCAELTVIFANRQIVPVYRQPDP
jgi:hypothetical protein